MKVLVLSDTHGSLAALSLVLKRLAKKVDMVLHLGDGLGDIGQVFGTLRLSLPWAGVRGNMDSDPVSPFLRVQEIGGSRLLMTHGHLQSVGSGPSSLVDCARAQNARAVFFGHTHKPFYEEYGGIVALNPGSLSRPRGRDLGTFALVVFGPDGPGFPEFFEVDPSRVVSPIKGLSLADF